MGRPQRAAEGGYVYHVLNRANARMTIFGEDGDYEAFERVLAEQLAQGKDRRVAEGQARRAAMLEARRKASGG